MSRSKTLLMKLSLQILANNPSLTACNHVFLIQPQDTILLKQVPESTCIALTDNTNALQRIPSDRWLKPQITAFLVTDMRHEF
jgi:hypothetical protein